MYCTHCGNKMDENAAFCTGCGAATQKTEQPTAAQPPVAQPVTATAPLAAYVKYIIAAVAAVAVLAGGGFLVWGRVNAGADANQPPAAQTTGNAAPLPNPLPILQATPAPTPTSTPSPTPELTPEAANITPQHDTIQHAVDFLMQFYSLRLDTGGNPWALPRAAEYHWDGGLPGEFILYDSQFFQIRTVEVPPYFMRTGGAVYNQNNERVTDAPWFDRYWIANSFSIWDFGNDGMYDILVNNHAYCTCCTWENNARLFRWIDGEYRQISLSGNWSARWNFYKSDCSRFIVYFFSQAWYYLEPVYAEIIFTGETAELTPLVDARFTVPEGKEDYCCCDLWELMMQNNNWTNRMTGETFTAEPFPRDGIIWDWDDDGNFGIPVPRERYIHGTDIFIRPIHPKTALREYIENQLPAPWMPGVYIRSNDEREPRPTPALSPSGRAAAIEYLATYFWLLFQVDDAYEWEYLPLFCMDTGGFYRIPPFSRGTMMGEIQPSPGTALFYWGGTACVGTEPGCECCGLAPPFSHLYLTGYLYDATGQQIHYVCPHTDISFSLYEDPHKPGYPIFVFTSGWRVLDGFGFARRDGDFDTAIHRMVNGHFEQVATLSFSGGLYTDAHGRTFMITQCWDWNAMYHEIIFLPDGQIDIEYVRSVPIPDHMYENPLLTRKLQFYGNWRWQERRAFTQEVTRFIINR